MMVERAGSRQQAACSRQQAACSTRLVPAPGPPMLHTTRDGIPHTLTHMAMEHPHAYHSRSRTWQWSIRMHTTHAHAHGNGASACYLVAMPHYDSASSSPLLPPTSAFYPPAHPLVHCNRLLLQLHPSHRILPLQQRRHLLLPQPNRTAVRSAHRAPHAARRALFGATGCTGHPNPEPIRAGPGRAGCEARRRPKLQLQLQRQQAAVDGSLPSAPMLPPAPCPLPPAP
jgi:hypothetical protein